MLIFLPPSEGKTRPNDQQASAVDLTELVLPEIQPARAEVAGALEEISRHDQARDVLKVGASVMPAVRANTELRESPAAPAHQIYSGVLYDALDSGSLGEAGLERAAGTVLIFSGLFGVARFTDRIPAYRLSMGVDLRHPDTSRGPGKLGAFWRDVLAEPLRRRVGEQLVVDCRSTAYAQAYRPRPEQTLTVNSFRASAGRRRVVTHFAKRARGELTGMLLRAQESPETVEEVAELASARWDVEVRPASGRTGHQLDLIEHD